MSYEIAEHFANNYANATVSWTGTVVRFTSFRHDTDFGEGPAIKATVLLGGSGRSRVVSNEVHAVIRLPDGAAIQRDSEIHFSGTLMRIDRFARKLYVDRAELQ